MRVLVEWLTAAAAGFPEATWVMDSCGCVGAGFEGRSGRGIGRKTYIGMGGIGWVGIGNDHYKRSYLMA